MPPQGGRKHPEQPMVKVNTKNILFICGGAFEDIERIIAQRVNNSKVGFKNNKEQKSNIQNEAILRQVNALDVKKFGLIPELLGRLPVIVYLNSLDREALKNILIQPKNALTKQYQELFKYENIALEFEDDAIEFIIDKAMDYELGARGLRSICEMIMTDIMYEAPNAKISKLKITRELAEKNFYQNDTFAKAS